ncbi:MAG: S24/S26 family peptidase [Clostridia bacterium]|nr:S24/S26 family peptidase [Clostridia bacterium]
MEQWVTNEPTPPPKEEKITLADLLPLIEEVIGKGKAFRLFPMGRSMLPLLKEGRDSVMLVAPSLKKWEKGDMLLYRRTDGAFVLHRVVAVAADGSLTMRGDSQYYDEKGVLPSQVIALVCGFYQKGHYRDCDSSLPYRFYLWRRAVSYPFRRFFVRAAAHIRRRCRKRGRR